MDDVFVYFVELPDGINEAVMPCLGGYTIYIDKRLSDYAQQRAYNHAMYHIRNHDFEKADVQSIEYEAHKANP